VTKAGDTDPAGAGARCLDSPRLLPGEVDAARAGHLIEMVASEGAIVPSHWRLEVVNALLMAEQRSRIVPERTLALLTRLAVLPIAIDPETAARAWDASPTLARKHQLSLYDAAYLELARRKHLPLASFDRRLLRAAEAEQVAAERRGADETHAVMNEGVVRGASIVAYATWHFAQCRCRASGTGACSGQTNHGAALCGSVSSSSPPLSH
jgi:predicted nucleic acid-binding protein